MRLLLVITLTGCSSLSPLRSNASGVMAASPPERCAKLSRDAEVQHIFAILLSGIATGGSGVAPVISNTIARDVVLGVAAASGLAGAVLSYTGGLAAATYAKECP